MSQPYVFISYKSEEQDKAAALKTALEQNKIKCWMAPESIPIGSNYPAEITRAIENCKVFILVLSDAAQRSEQILRELEIADQNKKVIMPYVIEKCDLIAAFKYYLCTKQMLNAHDHNRNALDTLIARIRAIINGTPASSPVPPREKTPASSIKVKDTEDLASALRRFKRQNAQSGSASQTHTTAKPSPAAAPSDSASVKESLFSLFKKAFISIESFEKCLEAAEKGNAEAQFSLGVRYFYAKGVKKDYKESAKWLTKAAEQGHADAQNNLAMSYLHGNGVPKDIKKAEELLILSANQGNKTAQQNLNELYNKKTKKNNQEKIKQENKDPQYLLALRYLKGDGVEKDEKKAEELLLLAANRGDKLAQFRLGLFYEERKNKAKAIEWYKKCGNKKAENQLRKFGVIT